MCLLHNQEFASPLSSWPYGDVLPDPYEKPAPLFPSTPMLNFGYPCLSSFSPFSSPSATGFFLVDDSSFHCRFIPPFRYFFSRCDSYLKAWELLPVSPFASRGVQNDSHPAFFGCSVFRENLLLSTFLSKGRVSAASGFSTALL